MLNLDNWQSFDSIDHENMLGEIDGLPDQLEQAWSLGQTLPLPEGQGVRKVIIAGMGGSAIGADLLAAYAVPLSPAPITVHRDYGLPAWAAGEDCLVICSSHSGNTEETLSSFEEASRRGVRLVCVTTGGRLAEQANEAGAILWTFEHGGQPRAAVGFSFGLLLALLARLNLLPDPSGELEEALQAMRAQQLRLRAESPLAQNQAKRLAGQTYGRMAAVFGSGVLAPVARRWKGQISEIAKAWAQFEFLPEADHNTLAGTLYPENVLSSTMALFLMAPSDHPRNRLRSEYTRKAFMLEGMNTDFVEAEGTSAMAHMWTALQYGDYLAYYLAMLYGVDPTPVEALQGLKAALAEEV
jgi:glucose/mannose-6-phosphate isomerase